MSVGAAGDGRRMLVEMKASAGQSPGARLPVGSPARAFLRPIGTRPETIRASDVKALTEWRNRHVRSFLTEFTATESRTAAWLARSVGPNEGKILFMVERPNDGPVGYMGLDFIDWVVKYGEADAVVRGADAPRGLMTEALRAMLDWARATLGLHALGVRVRSDNTALEFYRKAEFREERRVPLRRTVEGDAVRWVEDVSAAPDVSLVHMVYRPGE